MSDRRAHEGGDRVGSRDRLISLDAFRGLVIASMLLVNMTWDERSWGEGLGADIMFQLAHVPWNAAAQGATYTDLVFPWFVFIMGASVPIAWASRRERGASASAHWLRVARRTVVIYLLGVLLTHAGGWLERPMVWSDLLSWNILQLIALSYLVTSVVVAMPRWLWWAFVGAALGGKLVLMAAIDPDWVRTVMAGAGLSPRGDEALLGRGTFTHMDDVKRYLGREHIDAASGAWSALDRRLVGWLGMSQQWLPLGAVGVLGALAGDRLTRSGVSGRARAIVVLVGGVVAIALALLLEGGSSASGGGWLGPMTLPFSKWLMTPAYCLLSAGTGAVLLAAFFLLIDVARWRWAALPWRTFGVNALALYVGAELSWKLAFSRWQMQGPGGEATAMPGAINGHVRSWLGDGRIAEWGEVFGLAGSDGSLNGGAIAGLTFAGVWLFGWWLICWRLDRARIYIRV